MRIQDLQPGQIVKFTYKADRSHQPIQNVELRVETVAQDYIRGVNVNRILDGSTDSLPYRTYKIANIVQDTFWVRGTLG